MTITNLQVYREEGRFSPGELYTDGEFFTAMPPEDDHVLDGEGLYAIPGLVDIHLHGCAGADFSDATDEAIRKMACYQASVGVAAICPATMTLPEERLDAICRAAAGYQNNDPSAAELVGINMEGPFLSKDKLGAQNPVYLQKTDAAMFRRLQKAAGGLIKLLSMSPELPGAQTLIESVRNEVTISLAHTSADYETAAAAFELGADHVTHMFNAMPPFGHREPGVVGAAMDSGCTAELVCDGIHLHPCAVRAAFRMFGEDRLILVSDSMMATGMPDGRYELGELAVDKIGRMAVLADSSTIAGSVTNLMECLRILVLDMGIPLASAVRCASTNPARRVGADRFGSLEPGKYACLALLDEALRVRHIIHKGILL